MFDKEAIMAYINNCKDATRSYTHLNISLERTYYMFEIIENMNGGDEDDNPDDSVDIETVVNDESIVVDGDEDTTDEPYAPEPEEG